MRASIKAHMRASEYKMALSLILQMSPECALEDLEYATTALYKIPEEVIVSRVPLRKKLAILGGATTQFLVPLIRLFALRRGVGLEIYESNFGLFEQEVWSDSPALHAFAPDVIHFHVCSQNISFSYNEAEPVARLDAEVNRFLQLYRSAVERFDCSVLTNNFETDLERPYGSLDTILGSTRNNLIRATNVAIARGLPSQVFLHDVDALSAKHGKMRWFDWRLYNAAKAAVSFECQPYYADSVSAALAALFGQSRKCLVLDLDNTLWGGVIGDDGLGGIQLGAGQPAGEAFVAFQRYLKALKDRGVLLAVASKNDMETALLPFREHPDMVLKESDISCFIANWEPKDANIRSITKQLNIGLDSLVFFDDNPVERGLVKSSLPEVAVPEVPEDPSLYVQCLDNAHWFDTLGVTEEDRKRGTFFQSNAAREQLEKEASNYGDYLRQLSMAATTEPVLESNIVRITQLINKTNQFNLTTKRKTESEVRTLAADERYYTSSTRLTDKFGDNGLISVVIGSIDPSDKKLLHVDLWLMSCRVLKRDVEVLDFERLLLFCKKRGVKYVRGHFLPTTKNKLVEDHYATLGFTQVAADGEGTTWVYDVDAPLARTHTIAIRP